MHADKERYPAANHSPGAELLAPAGEKDAAYAALAYGADAIYVGTPRFSARAEAANLTLDEISEVTGYAHALTPRRRVYVALNTLIRDDELPDVADTLADLADIGIDAAIIQDLGVYALARRFFPALGLHASTQMAVHNLAGARTLARMGYRRVTLARELTLREIRRIAAQSGLETEVFVHGALCYCYSGLCLFSSHLRGRSGNRGRCAYPCRDAFRPLDSQAAQSSASLPFSMKDLAQTASAEALRDAGVSSLKIEGRKKSPLYVAAVTRLYRGLLDGSLGAAERAEIEADVRTVFSRPWTELYLDSPRRQTAIDPHWVGHRGTLVGKVESFVTRRGAPPALRFRTARAIERHDGLQIDLPGQDRPYGFPVDTLRIIEGARSRSTFEAAAGAAIEVDLPADAPRLPAGAPVYCSSSQAVKRKYRFPSPKTGEFRVRDGIAVTVTVDADRIRAAARPDRAASAEAPIETELVVEKPFEPAKSADGMREAAERTFAKTGATSLRVTAFEWSNPLSLFVPVSTLNDLRRDVTAKVETHLSAARAAKKAEIRQCQMATPFPSEPHSSLPAPLQWSLKVDNPAFLADFSGAQWATVSEVVIDIARPSLPDLLSGLSSLEQQVGRSRIRLALPIITREWEEEDLSAKVERLLKAAWTRWEASNLSALDYLRAGGTSIEALDVAADWPLFAMNRCAASQLQDLRIARFTLSPEDGLPNMCSLIRHFPEACTLILYQDTPLFISETCAFAAGNEGCRGLKRCQFRQMPVESSKGESLIILNLNCRTVTINRDPFSLLPHLPALRAAGVRHVRADFIWRPYTASEVAATWNDLRAGTLRRASHAGNATRRGW